MHTPEMRQSIDEFAAKHAGGTAHVRDVISSDEITEAIADARRQNADPIVVPLDPHTVYHVDPLTHRDLEQAWQVLGVVLTIPVQTGDEFTPGRLETSDQRGTLSPLLLEAEHTMRSVSGRLHFAEAREGEIGRGIIHPDALEPQTLQGGIDFPGQTEDVRLLVVYGNDH